MIPDPRFLPRPWTTSSSKGASQAPHHQGGGRGARGRHFHHEVTMAPAHPLALAFALAHATALCVHLRFHVFIDSKESCKGFRNIVSGTIDAYNTLETFPVLSYPMNSMDGTKTKAELFPLADPAKKFGLHSLGLVNSLAITDGRMNGILCV